MKLEEYVSLKKKLYKYVLDFLENDNEVVDEEFQRFCAKLTNYFSKFQKKKKLKK